MHKVPDWSCPTDERNPQNWSLAVKVYHAWIIFGFSFLALFNANLFINGYEEIQLEFNVGYEASLVPYVTFIAGIVLGTLLAGPLSEAFGRRFAYLCVVPLSGVFIIGVAVASNYATLVICRFFAGLFTGPAISVAGGLIADVFKVQDRLLVITLIVVGPFLGPSMALAFGGFLVESKGWRWTQWLSAILLLIMTLFSLGMRETYKKIILDHEVVRCHLCKLEEGDADDITDNPSLLAALKGHVFRPVHMLLKEPLVLFLSIYTGLAFGITYGFYTAVPYIFGTQYDFSPLSTGLVFLGLSAGYIVAACGVVTLALYRRRKLQKMIAAKQRPAMPAPEAQLLLGKTGSPAIVVALFVLGWSAHAKVHWMVPVVALGVYGCGFILVFLSISTYLNVAYGAQYGASASSANRMVAYVCGVGFPLFTRQMMEKLGPGWGCSLFGFLALALTPLPWIFKRYGPKIRARSSMAVGSAASK